VISLRRRKPEATQAVGPEPTLEEPVDVVAAQWTTGSAWGTKAFTILLWVGLAAGPVALLWLAVVGNGTTQAAPVAAPQPVKAQTVAAEFSERFVVAWLTSERTDADAVALMTTAADLVLPNEPLTVTNIATASITEVPGGSNGRSLWSITTAADVAEKSGTYRRYFQVPVQVDNGAAVALTHPAVVPAPNIATADTVALPEQWATTSPAAASVEQFLTALLTGVGEVTRYLAPDIAITPVTPAPFETIDLRGLQADTDELDIPDPAPNGTKVGVLGAALATLNDSTQLSTQYALTIQSRDGRWEIAALDPAPPVTPAQPGDNAPETPPSNPTTEGETK
jgi:hypothetical protein